MNKKQWFSLLVIAGISAAVSKPAWADTASSNAASDEQLINKVTAQENALEQQVTELKAEVKELKQEQAAQQKVKTTVVRQVVVVKQTQAQPTTAPAVAPNTVSGPGACPVQAVAQPVSSGGAGYQTPLGAVKTPYFLPGTPVVIAPYVGDHTKFDASDLVINYTPYNEDLRLLQLRQGLFDYCGQNNYLLPDNPILMLSGKVEGQLIYSRPFTGGHTSQTNLATAELDLFPIINSWASGFMGLIYDNTQIPNTQLVSNSRFFIDQGFITIGNLNRSPLFLTLGQFYVPYGSYSSNMITDPITEDIFQIKDRAVELGYQHSGNGGLYAQLFAFNGDSGTSTGNNGGTNANINNAGGNVGFNITEDSWNLDIGGSAIANVADSLGMQRTGSTTLVPSPTFTGFVVPTVNNAMPDVLHRQVPGVDGHLTLGIGSFSFIAEYMQAASQFAFQDMTFNGAPAEPKAYNAELSYSFTTFDRPSALSVGTTASYQALALNVPRDRLIAAYNISIWKDTIETLEFHHDNNYGYNDTATAAGTPVFVPGLGGISNTVTAQLGIYF